MSVKTIKYGNVRKISGWLGWVDYEIFKDLVAFQSEFSQTAISEIGVHHGKSFIPLAGFSRDRKLYAIDIFEDQEKNIDGSGMGDKRAFLDNLSRFAIDAGRLTIDQRMSTAVTAADIENAVGRVGLFHIDGGHHYDAVLSDIRLAIEVSVEESIIVLDDVFRPEWPEVSIAAFGSRDLIENEFVPFAIGFNKTYFCKTAFVDKYQALLRSNSLLEKHLTKPYQVHRGTILVYQRYPLPEWGLPRFLFWYLSVWCPSLFNFIFPSTATLRKFVK